MSTEKTTVTETAADGTETVAEMTTTVGDDAATIEQTLTVTETAPDGTETVIEYTTTSGDASLTIDDDESLLEQVIEAVFDVEVGDAAGGNGADVAATDEQLEFEVAGDAAELDAGSVDFTAGDEMFAPSALPTDAAEAPAMATPFDPAAGIAEPTFSAATASDTSFDSAAETAAAEAAAEAAEQEAHAQAASEAQASADEFIADGDYAAAAQAREVAENEAWEAGDQSMLSAYDASDLAQAAEKQEEAQDYRAQQAEHAQQGDYEAARESAGNAAYATSEADFSAGGADHTGQSDAEHYNLDWAVHEQKQADSAADNAAAYAAEGDFENAEMYAASATEHQASADHFGELGTPGADQNVFDPSSVVESGGSYESTFDASAAQVDTGFDAGTDMSASTGYDSGMEEV